MALPYLAVIRDDRVTFHRLFRRKACVFYKDVVKVEILANKLPVKEYPWGVCQIVFHMRDGGERIIMGISNKIAMNIIDAMRRKYTVEYEESTRKLTQEEINKYVKGKHGEVR